MLCYVNAYETTLDLLVFCGDGDTVGVIVAVAGVVLLIVRFHNDKYQRRLDTVDNHVEFAVSFGSCAKELILVPHNSSNCCADCMTEWD